MLLRDNPKDAYLLATKLLASREHSSMELRLKLMRRGYDDAHITAIIERLQMDNLLSDERFTEMYVRMRKQRGYGPLRIQAELQQRGISDDVIAYFIQDTADEWLQWAAQVNNKKFGSKRSTDFNTIVKQKRFLQYRGFELEVINRLFRTG